MKSGFAQLADEIIGRGARAVLIAGPSQQRKDHERKPPLHPAARAWQNTRACFAGRLLPRREKLKPGPDGKIDLEDIATLDIPQFQSDLTRLLRGEEVELPCFDFIRQCRKTQGRKLISTRALRLSSRGCMGSTPCAAGRSG
jgi:uridine kinase